MIPALAKQLARKNAARLLLAHLATGRPDKACELLDAAGLPLYGSNADDVAEELHALAGELIRRAERIRRTGEDLDPEGSQ